MPATDDAPDKLIYDDSISARFSDRCNGCGHTRADHLASPLAPHPFGLADCTVLVCSLTLDPAHPEHTKDKCSMVPCGDSWSNG